MNRNAKVMIGSLLILAGCDLLEPSPGQAPADLHEARALWASAGVDDYELVIDRSCFCAHHGPVRVRVVGGAKISVTLDSESGEPIPLPAYPDVEGLFDIVADAVAREAHRLRVAYHPSLGYPTQIDVDYEQRVADDEVGYDVTLRVTAGDS